MLPLFAKRLLSLTSGNEEFRARASHELRTPMNHTFGFGQLLEMDELSCQQQESVQQILTRGRELKHAYA